MRGSRGKVAAALALDVVLDDRPENCLDVLSDSKAKPILIWRRGRGEFRPPLPGCRSNPSRSMSEALACLDIMTHGTRPDVAGRPAAKGVRQRS